MLRNEPINHQKESVIIIGAGISGLMAADRLSHMDRIILERRPIPGGVFSFDEKEEITVAQFTVLSSSKHVTQISDYHFPEGSNDFIHQEEMGKYIKNYARDRDLEKDIRYNAKVVKVEKKNNKWYVHYQNTTSDDKDDITVISSDKLIVASGLHSKVLPLEEKYTAFTGTMMPSHTIKKIDPSKFKGQRVLILGGSESASDLAFEILPIVDTPDEKGEKGSLHWSIRNHPVFFKARGKITGDVPSRFFSNKVTAYDTYNNYMIATISRPMDGKKGSAWGCSYTTAGHLNSPDGHDIPEWSSISPSKVFGQFQNKKEDIVEWVRNRTITPHGDIKEINGKFVTFLDKNEDGVVKEVTKEFDIIIPSFGFQPDLSYLPKKYHDISQYYDFIWCTDDTSLALVGMTRPTIGSMPLLADLSTRFIRAVWTGEVQLPSKERMDVEQFDYKGTLRKLFENTPQRNA